mgnify:CR=1
MKVNSVYTVKIPIKKWVIVKVNLLFIVSNYVSRIREQDLLFSKNLKLWDIRSQADGISKVFYCY